MNKKIYFVLTIFIIFKTSCFGGAIGMVDAFMANHQQMKVAAEKNDPNAQYVLGMQYLTGLSISKDPGENIQDEKLAFKWFSRAAEMGNEKAMFQLSLIFNEGRIQPKNDKLAFSWMEKSAKKGYKDAKTQLGLYHLLGTGCNKDSFKAIRYFLETANEGSSLASYFLAICYENGEGTPQNYYEAYTWYSVAVALSAEGDKKSYSERRDNVGTKLSNSDMVKAQQKATEIYNHFMERLIQLENQVNELKEKSEKNKN